MEPQTRSMTTVHLHGGIAYSNGDRSIGSDLCFDLGMIGADANITPDIREFYHEALDEFLNQGAIACSQGLFFIGTIDDEPATA